MASGNERRMVFDIRGRRKHVVKFVYAILAILMGASLFLVVGPVSLGNLLGGGTSTSNGAAQQEEQVERLERKLKKSPEDPDLLLSLTRARISAGDLLATTNPETGAIEFTPESTLQLEEASESWAKYLKSTDEPNPGTAQLVAKAQFGLAENASITEAESNVHAAAAAQQIVAEARPSLGSLSTLAIYRNYAFDYKGAKEAEKEAGKYAESKFARENLGNELATFKKRAVGIQKALGEIKKAEKEAKKKGEPGAANPLSAESFGSPTPTPSP